MRAARLIAATILAATGIVVAGCSGGSTDADGTRPPSPSAPPSASPSAAADADEALLPIPVADIASWAEAAVPGADAEGYSGRLSGWLSENSAHQMSKFQSLEPGSYQAQVACRGDGEITVTAGDLGGVGSAEPVECANETIAFDVTTRATGMQVQLDLEGAPSIYAFSLVRIG